jgi:hypothetical protein
MFYDFPSISCANLEGMHIEIMMTSGCILLMHTSDRPVSMYERSS